MSKKEYIELSTQKTDMLLFAAVLRLENCKTMSNHIKGNLESHPNEGAKLLIYAEQIAFSAELLLKYIAQKDSKRFLVGHDIKKLFDDLNQGRKNRICQEMGLEISTLRTQLEQHKDCFIASRYFFELKKDMRMDFEFYEKFIKSISGIAQDIHNQSQKIKS